MSFTDTCRDEFGNLLALEEGMNLIAFDEDADENGNPNYLVASGIVEQATGWLKDHGSKWVLHIDENGIYHVSELE